MTDLRPLGKAARDIRWYRHGLRQLGWVAVAVAATVMIRIRTDFDVPLWPVLALIAVTTVIGWIWIPIEHRRWGWRLTEDLFEVAHGVLVRRTSIVPRSRIQNVTTSAGPLQSRLGLVTLSVQTAGARTRAVQIRDIDVGHAASIRRQLGVQ